MRTIPSRVWRAELYRDLQRRLQVEGPYVIMFQHTEQMARRRIATGLITGPAFDQTWYRTVTKQPSANTDSAVERSEHP